jgi:predicted TIM-barrel fold metal-dependent hydrolase
LDIPGHDPDVGTELSHADLLRRARMQADERGFDDVLIIDADFHHSEHRAWQEILEYVDDEVLRQFLQYGGRNRAWIPGFPMSGEIQDVAGRIPAARAWNEGHRELDGASADLALAREAMDAMSLDYVSFFPTMLLDIGGVRYDLEAPLTAAWARWVTERLLPKDNRLVTLLPLPLSDPAASLALVERYSGTCGVVGFMVTSVRYEPLYKKQYAPLFRAIEDGGLTLAFHTSFTAHDRPVRQLNRFLSIHSITLPLFHMIQASNWIVNGMPERYPGLKLIFIEGGLAWVPFLMQRLDHEYAMRVSEAPLLTRRPSEYMREFFYTSQPLETTDLKLLQTTLEAINAETQLLYASDWPHWDWDPPRKIWDLPFLGEQAKRNILGLNAQRVWGLEETAPAPSAPARQNVSGTV